MEGVENNVQEGVCGKETVRRIQVRRGQTFGGNTVNDTQKQLHQRGHTASFVLELLPNQMLDLLEGYLDNIDVAAATQAVTKRGPLEELSASLLISIDKVVLKKKKLSVCMNKLKP